MDFGNFLNRLDESSAKLLREWNKAGAVDSWASLPDDVKAALSSEGISGTWAYMPANRDLIVVEEGPNSWSLFNLKAMLNNSRKRSYSGKRLNEAGPMNFEVDGLDSETTAALTQADRNPGAVGGPASRPVGGGAGEVKAIQIAKGDFATILKECVQIVKEDAYKEQ